MEPTSNSLDYVFVLGKNRLLSMFEILCYLKSRGVVYELKNFHDAMAVLEIKGIVNCRKVIEDLGGTIKIGKLIGKLDLKEISFRDIGAGLLTEVEGGRVRFGLSVYGEPKIAKTIWNDVTNQFKKVLRDSNVKMIHVSPKTAGSPVLQHYEVLKKLSSRGGFEIAAFIVNKDVYVSKTIAVHDPYEFKKRDVERPVQRSIFSIPPRLAKILVNLSLAVPGDVLLDPFCGVGTILQEALLMGIDIKGIDLNPKCIRGATTNLEWLKGQYGLSVDLKGKLIVGDAKKLSSYVGSGSVDAVATEPYLGPPLSRKPTRSSARKILDNLEPLYIKSLEEMNVVLRSEKKASIVFPNFETRDGTVLSINPPRLAQNAGFSILDFGKEFFIEQFLGLDSITEGDRTQKTQRKICVLKKER